MTSGRRSKALRREQRAALLAAPEHVKVAAIRGHGKAQANPYTKVGVCVRCGRYGTVSKGSGLCADSADPGLSILQKLLGGPQRRSRTASCRAIARDREERAKREAVKPTHELPKTVQVRRATHPSTKALANRLDDDRRQRRG